MFDLHLVMNHILFHFYLNLLFSFLRTIVHMKYIPVGRKTLFLLKFYQFELNYLFVDIVFYKIMTNSAFCL